MDDLRELYQEVILDHGKNPRNFAFPDASNCEADGYNPLCGDQLTVKARVEGDVVLDVGFQGQGCAISTAAASTMTEWAKGKTRSQIDEMFELFHSVVTGKKDADEDELGKLAVFGGVAEYPMRVKCATLAWHTLEAALAGKKEASTE